MKVLILKTVASDMTAHGGFKYPESGPVSAPDWDPKPNCGKGLHGALWGEGDGSLFRWDEDAKWLVLEDEADDVVDLDGKVKVPKAEVVHVGTSGSATQFILDRAPGRAVIGATVSAGNYGTARVGFKGTATAGDIGTAIAGNYGTAKAGNGGTAIAGYKGTAIAGDVGTAKAGNGGTATAGDIGTAIAGYEGTAIAGYEGTATAGAGGTATAGNYGTAKAGNGGTAKAGYKGTATAGYKGTATAGDDGTATSGHKGTASAGVGGIIQISCYVEDKRRIVTGYVGEDGIEAYTFYEVVDGKLVKA